MKSSAEPLETGGGPSDEPDGGQMERRLTWALNLAAFIHILVSPYTKVHPYCLCFIFLSCNTSISGGRKFQLASNA